MRMHKNIDGSAASAMTMLCLVWSMQQIGLKATANDASPIFQVALRSGLAAALVALLMLWRREAVNLRALPWRAGIGAGLLFALEYLLLGAGLGLTSAAHGVVFLYTAPLFAAIGLHFKQPSERLVPLQWFGIILAFAGIVVAFSNPEASHSIDASTNFLGDALCLGAGLVWGSTTVLVRGTRLATISVTQVTMFQLVVAFLVLLPVSGMLGQWSFRPTPTLLANLVFQTLIVSFASLLLWFALLSRYAASNLGAFSFLTPLFGVCLGSWLLDEKIKPAFVLGALFVLTGIVCVSCHGWLKSRTLIWINAGE